MIRLKQLTVNYPLELSFPILEYLCGFLGEDLEVRNRDRSVRRQAVIALGKIKDKSAVLPLIDLVDIESNTREPRRDIQEALRSIGSHRAVREVISRLT